jgi:bifunctional DNA-binding transcriptional regulator/antitoxin component of YhaV-PrlF toxin-antitoxin module
MLIFCPIHWVIRAKHLTETTFYKDKVYLPREVQERLGLTEGDILRIEVVEKGVAKLEVARSCNAAARILERLESPPDMGRIKGKLSREEIYEDVT